MVSSCKLNQEIAKLLYSNPICKAHLTPPKLNKLLYGFTVWIKNRPSYNVVLNYTKQDVSLPQPEKKTRLETVGL